MIIKKITPLFFLFMLTACNEQAVLNVYAASDFELFEGCFLNEFALTATVDNDVVKEIHEVSFNGRYGEQDFAYEISLSLFPNDNYLDKDYFLVLRKDDDLYFELLFTCRIIDNNLKIAYLEFDNHYFFQGNESKWRLPSLLAFKETLVYD